MSDGLARVLSKTDFDAESFVKKQLNSVVLNNVDELASLRKEVGRLKGETSVALKKNVYKHYSQFIDTAKEISILEGEMYQMSHLLTEQKNIINHITETTFYDRKDQKVEKEKDENFDKSSSQLSLSFLLEKIEGCCDLTKTSATQLVHHGDLLEHDIDTGLPLCRVHLFLLSDSLLVTSCLPKITNTFEYRFEALYELQNLAVVNVKETADLTCAFKIFVFPVAKLYSVSSPKIKKKWLESLDEWKKVPPPNLQPPSLNPFEDPKDDWLIDAPEDIDVLLVQRDFELAVELIIKVEKHIKEHPNFPDAEDFMHRLEQKKSKVADTLTKELSVSAERSIRIGLKSLRRVACLLLLLGRVLTTCDLFLSNRSRVCHHLLKQLTNESETLPYITNLCQCFFSNMAGICDEFKMVFRGHNKCYSVFLQWCQQEMQYFCGLFNKQVFDGNIPFSTVAACVVEAKKGCSKLSGCGMDMLFILEDLLHDPLLASIRVVGDVHMDAVKHRASDDHWRTLHLQTPQSLRKLHKQMLEMGVNNIETYDKDEVTTYLTSNTIEFSKNYIVLCQQLTSLYTPPLNTYIVEGLTDILNSFTTHFLKASENPKVSKTSMVVVRKNSNFVCREIVPIVLENFYQGTGYNLRQLSAIGEKLANI